MKISTSWLKPAALLLLVQASVLSVSAQSSLYGVTFFGNELIKIDTATGAGSLVAPLGETVSPYGIAYHGDQLYAFDAGSLGLRTINTTTGVVSGSIDIGLSNMVGEGDLAFRSDGAGFISSALTGDFEVANDLFRFDLATATSVRVGTTDVVLDGMAFWGDTLYAIGQEAGPMLYIVNQMTAALTAVGSLGLESGNPFGALAAGADGTLYGSINDRLYVIDRLTGLASELDPTVLDIGFASVSGLAFAPSGASNVPESGTYEVQVMALLLLGHFARRKWHRNQTASHV